MPDLYRAIWRQTGAAQLLIIVLSLAVAGLAAVPLDYQKRIVNAMSEGASFDLLLGLGLTMLGIILFSLVLKWLLGYRSGIVGEDVVRRLRAWVVGGERLPSGAHAGNLETGTLANIVSSEAETVGKFVGDAFAEPLLQLGTLASVTVFIFYTSPTLGLIVLAMVAVQAALVLGTQARINALVHERVVLLRDAINEITETDLEAVRAAVVADFDRIYDARRRIFIWKLSTKLILSLINGIGLVVVLVLGGWFVTQGHTDVGSVVAATVGLGRIQAPWRQLIGFYRKLSAVRVQFELLREVLVLGRHQID